MPSRTVEVTAADLPAYIAGLPRLLTESLAINVSGTLTADALEIYTFYGPGTLTVRANADGDAVLKTSAKVYDCTVPVTFNNIRFQDPMPGSDIYRTGIRVENFGNVTIINCSFSSANGGTVHQNGYTAIFANNGGIITTIGIRNISGCACAVNATKGGVVVCSAKTADAMYDNSVGAIVYEGGIVYVCGSSPDTLGGITNGKYCGLIVKGDTLL